MSLHLAPRSTGLGGSASGVPSVSFPVWGWHGVPLFFCWLPVTPSGELPENWHFSIMPVHIDYRKLKWVSLPANHQWYLNTHWVLKAIQILEVAGGDGIHLLMFSLQNWSWAMSRTTVWFRAQDIIDCKERSEGWVNKHLLCAAHGQNGYFSLNHILTLRLMIECPYDGIGNLRLRGDVIKALTDSRALEIITRQGSKREFTAGCRELLVFGVSGAVWHQAVTQLGR